MACRTSGRKLPISSLAALLFTLLSSSANAQLPAFPGAEGYGSIATGGRGGDVYYVTNRNASGAGSFAYGVQTAPPAGRTILFAVSGHIRLPSGSGGGLTVSNSKITVAGQTAPGDGICFWNNTMNITGNDLVFRNIRWRYGFSAAGGDAVDVSGSQRIIFDHCEVMFGTDENMSSFGAPPEHLTFQWSANAWGLFGHSAGGLWKTQHATVHHTLWANNHTRNPKLIGCDVFDWVNNLTFGWNNGFNMAQETTGGSGYVYRVNIRNSWFVHGGNTGEAIYGGGTNDDLSNKFKLHMADAALDGGTAGTLNATRTNYAMVSSSQYDQVSTPWQQTTNGVAGAPVIGVQVNAVSRNTAYKKILSQVGATRMEIGTRPLRDEITQLLADRTAALQRTHISNPLELGLSTGTAFADLKSDPAPVDTDLDGMPDDWEEAIGYNKSVADNNLTLTAPETAASFFPAGSPVGYTRLEEYLHYKAVPHGTVAKSTAISPSFIDIDLRKFTSGFTASPSFSVSNIANGSVTQSGPGNAIVRFQPNTDVSGRGGFNFTVTDSAGDSWTQQCCLLISTQSQPRPVTWVGDGVSNSWDSTSLNFTSLIGPTAFANGDAVTINDAGSNNPTLKVIGTLNPGSLEIHNSAKNFTLEGSGSLAGTGGLTKTGTGSLTLRVNYSGTGSGLIDGGSVILGGPANTGSLPSGTLTLQNGASITNAWPSSSSTQNITAPLMIPADETATVQTGRRIQLGGTVTGEGTLNIAHQGTDNVIQLRGAMNNFAGNLHFTYTGTNPGMSAVFNGASFNGWGAASVQFPAPLTLSCTTNSTGNTFNIGALHGSGTLGGGSSGSPVYTIGGLNQDSTFSGSFTGNARLTKTGSGILTLTGNSSHSAATAVNSGSLALLGNFGTSPVNIAANATLSGTGTLGGSLSTSAGAILSPGADNGNSAGTLTAASLSLSSPTLRFDISNNPAVNNDSIQISGGGSVSISGNLNFIFNLTDGHLNPGTYDLITTSGTLTASGASLSSNLPTGTRQTLSLEHSPSGTSPGWVRLVVTGDDADLIWTGSNGGIWDQQTTASWTGASPATFFNFDRVTFNDSAVNGTVTISQPVAPQSITVNNSPARSYIFSGGPIEGSASLVKSGTGTLTLYLPQYIFPSGNTTTLGSPGITVNSTANLFRGMTVTGVGIPLGTTIAAINSATSLTLSNNSTASGSPSLTFETRNSYTGGTQLNGGTLILSSNATQTSGSITAPANSYGLGTGPITFNGGTLTLHGHTGASGYLDVLYGPLNNALIVPAGQTGHLNLTTRGSNSVPFPALTGPLTGAGTLNFAPNYYRASISGDWSAFSGILNVKRPPSGVSDPRIQFAAETGLPLATVNLEQVRMEYTAVPPSTGALVEIGSLSGISSSVISGSQNASGTVTWRVGSLNTSTTFAGSFTPFLTHAIGLEKTGTGTLTLTGTGTISAGIKVEQGSLSYGDASTDTLSGTSEISVDPNATLQLNSGAKVIGASCEIFTGGTLRGLGTLQAPLTSSGLLSIIGGTFHLSGNASLGGSVQFSAFTDRVNVTGDLHLDGQLAIPTTGLSFGRKPLITYSGNLTLGQIGFPTLPSTYLPILDASVAGEIAVLLVDNAAFQTWQNTHFGSISSPESQPHADPDNDGMTNFEEYQAGTLPNDAASSIPLVWQGGGSNLWDLATTANWLENTTARVFRDKRQVSITDTGSNSPNIDLRGSLSPGSFAVSISTKAYTLAGNGSIEGSTGLTKSGTNILTLQTANTYSGPTLVNAGVLNLQNPTALGTTSGSTAVANNARLELQGNMTISGETLTLSGTGGPSFFNGSLNSKSGTNTWAGPVILAANDTRIGAQGGATLAISGPISSAPGISNLTVRPNDITSTVILSGANTWSGDTSIVGGVLQLGAANTLPTGTRLRLGLSNVSGKLNLAGFDQEISGFGAASGTSNEITSTSPATLTVNTTVDSTLPVPLSGSAALTKSGSATLTLSSPHTYTGTTTVSDGKLLLDLSSLATPTDIINPISQLNLSGILEINGKPATQSSQTLANPTIPANSTATIIVTPNGSTSTNLSLGNTWTLGSGASLLIDLSAGNATLTSSPALSGGLIPGVSVKDAIATGPATVVGGQVVRYVAPTLTISSNDANIEYSSLNSAYPGGILQWTNGGTLSTRAVHRLILDSSISGGTIDMGIPSNILTLTSGEIQYLGNNDLTLTGGQIGVMGSIVSLNTSGTNTLTLASPISGGAGSLLVSGAAQVDLNSASTFTGGLTLNGGTLKQGIAGALGSVNGTLTLHSGTLDLNGIITGAGILTGPGGAITSTSAATLTLGNNNASGGNFAGSISGPISLTKTGSGTQILSGLNPYTGLTTVSTGIIRSGADHAIGNGDITINGGILDLQSFSDTAATLSLTSGSIIGSSGLLTADSYLLTSGTISARLGGASSTLAKSGSTYSQSVTLSGANTYGGATTLGLNSGSLIIAHNNALGATPSIDVSGSGSALVLADGITISNKPITLRGTGANNGSNLGSFSGSLTTQSSATATWTGSVTLGDGNGRLGSGNLGTLSISGPILGSSPNQSLSLSSGSGTNIGTVILSGNNAFTGNISLVRGNLKLGAAHTLPASAVIDVGSASVTENTSFDLNGFPQTLAGLRRSSTNSTQISSVTNSSATPATLTLQQSANLTYSGRITGKITLVKSGTGTLSLTSAATLSPSVTLMLDAGALSLASSHTISGLHINGSWQPAGVYSSSNSGGRITGAGSLTVTASGPPEFVSWIATFPSLTGSNLLPTADPDGDGSSNLLEFALHGDPADPSNNGFMKTAVEDTNGDTLRELTLTIAVRNEEGPPVFAGSPSPSARVDGISYTIEGSQSLASPFADTPVTETALPTGLPALPAGWEYRRFRLDSSGNKGFLRLKLE